jgi:hypothetical protein
MIFILVIYFVVIDKSNGFGDNFLQFGPNVSSEQDSTDASGEGLLKEESLAGDGTSFLGVTLDTWPKVITLYLIGFFSSFMSEYYESVVSETVSTAVWNDAVRELEGGRFSTYLITTFDPLIGQILEILKVLTAMTMQLQFIVPSILGSYAMKLPISFYMLSKKSFI